MWPFKKTARQRRLEVRKAVPAVGASTWQRFRDAGGIGAALVALVFYAGAVLMDIWPLEASNYRPATAGRIAGRAAVLLLVTVLLCLHVAKYQPSIVRHVWRSVSLAAVMLFMLALNRTMVSVLGLNPGTAVLPVMMGAMCLVIAYDHRFAFAMTAILAFMTVFQLPAAVFELRTELGMFVVLMAAGTAVIYQLYEIRTRSKLIMVSGVVAAIVLAATWAVGAAEGRSWWPVLRDGLWGAGFALLAGFLVQGILPLIERIFRVATSMTLLEWCDANKPLLKRLAMDAPGTYNHSLQLGTMCEAAAEAIGARGLLARVGAYYHDVGKIHKPDYFVENQADSPSRHDKLSPAMSLLIIIGHVKDGVEMARQYGLPGLLHEFVETHHGTTLVEYFYQAATEQRKAEAKPAPDEVEFRYPGPKPQTKEPAILMLADAAESSVRAMSEPTPGRIENQVHTMVSRRLMDGQLDRCELTLKEVHLIESSLIKSLCGIYHARISYPPTTGQTQQGQGQAQGQKNRAGEKRSGPAENSRARPDTGGPSDERTGRPATEK